MEYGECVCFDKCHRLKMHADFAADPFWCAKCGRNIGMDKLSLSKELQKKITEWAKQYGNWIDLDSDKLKENAEIAEQQHNQQGIELFEKIILELGDSDLSIEFALSEIAKAYKELNSQLINTNDQFQLENDPAFKEFLQEAQIGKKVVDEYASKSYSELAGLDYPIHYEYKEEDKLIQIEIDILEREKECVHLSVAVSGGGITDYIPVTRSFIIHSNGRIEK